MRLAQCPTNKPKIMKKTYYMFERDWSMGGMPRNEREGEYTEEEIEEMKRNNPDLRVFDDYCKYMYAVND